MGKRQNLEHFKWVDAIPLILSAREAYALEAATHHFYMVSWRDDHPAGFSRFEFTGVVAGAYEIKITHKLRVEMTALEADEWVLVFGQDKR